MYNFRPISLLISFSKIFEEIICTRIYAHVVLNKILANEQYRFRSGLSTDNASYTLIHEILSAMNNKHTVASCWILSIRSHDARSHEYKMEENVKEMIIPTIIDGLCTVCVMQ